ncbi:hypothetical protein HDU92_008641 [Lobulomyces angularis]|nr:hypothetical protein HDU92_008641 [Lobulomyces angularis]
MGIGDLHGDYDNTVRILTHQQIIDKDLNWNVKDSILVQTGDIVDRGPGTILLYKLFQTLSKQAQLHGGRVVSLLGNHEVMNMMGDLRYVDPGDMQSFGGADKRKREWSKSGNLGKYLRKLNITEIVGDSVFVHGGINLQYAKIGVDNINKISRDFLNLDFIPMNEILIHPDCPLWYRTYATEPESKACMILRDTLDVLGVKRMIIGHTPQESGKILSRCNMSLKNDKDTFQPRLYVIDLAISKAYGALGQGLLEIKYGENFNNVSIKGLYFNEIVNFV